MNRYQDARVDVNDTVSLSVDIDSDSPSSQPAYDDDDDTTDIAPSSPHPPHAAMAIPVYPAAERRSRRLNPVRGPPVAPRPRPREPVRDRRDVHDHARPAILEPEDVVDSPRIYSARQFEESEESEPPKYHCLTDAVPHVQTYHYPAADRRAMLKRGAAVDERAVLSVTPSLPPKIPPPGEFWRKHYMLSTNSYRSIQDTLNVPDSHDDTISHITRRELMHNLSERMSGVYLDSLRYCGLPVVITPRRAAIYSIIALVAVNGLALILSWASLFSVDPSPAVITYTLTILLGITPIPSLFVFWAYKFNPFVAVSTFASTAFSGTFMAGLLQAFFVANNHDTFEDAKMISMLSAAAAFDIISSAMWLVMIIAALIFYTADSRQRGHHVLRFIAFNVFAIIVLVTFLLTLLMDVTFFDKVGQISVMYLAILFSIMSLLFSLCFCFCTGVSLRERESSEHDEWSKFIVLLPFLLSIVLTILSFVCGISPW